jgi:DNA-directed RNA polymerase specialized sigma24 family protein
MTDNRDLSQALLDRIDVLIRLQALTAVARLENQKDKIIFLGAAGLASREIADILGTTTNTVSVALSNARKARPGKSKEDEGNG